MLKRFSLFLAAGALAGCVSDTVHRDVASFDSAVQTVVQSQRPALLQIEADAAERRAVAIAENRLTLEPSPACGDRRDFANCALVPLGETADLPAEVPLQPLVGVLDSLAGYAEALSQLSEGIKDGTEPEIVASAGRVADSLVGIQELVAEIGGTPIYLKPEDAQRGAAVFAEAAQGFLALQRAQALAPLIVGSDAIVQDAVEELSRSAEALAEQQAISANQALSSAQTDLRETLAATPPASTEDVMAKQDALRAVIAERRALYRQLPSLAAAATAIGTAHTALKASATDDPDSSALENAAEQAFARLTAIREDGDGSAQSSDSNLGAD